MPCHTFAVQRWSVCVIKESTQAPPKSSFSLEGTTRRLQWTAATWKAFFWVAHVWACCDTWGRVLWRKSRAEAICWAMRTRWRQSKRMGGPSGPSLGPFMISSTLRFCTAPSKLVSQQPFATHSVMYAKLRMVTGRTCRLDTAEAKLRLALQDKGSDHQGESGWQWQSGWICKTLVLVKVPSTWLDSSFAFTAPSRSLITQVL